MSITLLPLFLLSACAMQNHSFVNNEPLKVENEQVVHEMTADGVSRSVLNGIADDVKRRSTSDVSVLVHYDGLKKPLKATQQVADAQGQRVKSYLNQQGVRQRILVLSEPDATDATNTISVSYSALKALGPSNCMDITHADADRFSHSSDSGYYYGCTGDKYLSQMIARPGDLLGNDTTTPADSQRLGRSQEVYRAGERATDPADEGVSASNVYSE